MGRFKHYPYTCWSFITYSLKARSYHFASPEFHVRLSHPCFFLKVFGYKHFYITPFILTIRIETANHGQVLDAGPLPPSTSLYLRWRRIYRGCEKKTIQHIEFMYTVYHNLNEYGYLMPKMGIDWLLIGVGVVFELLEDFEGSMIYSNRANAPDTFAWYRNGRDWLRMASIKKWYIENRSGDISLHREPSGHEPTKYGNSISKLGSIP